MKRSEFLEISLSAAAIACLNAHALFGASGCVNQKSKVSKPGLIKTLRLSTNRSLAEMKEFYGKTIGLNVDQKANELIIYAGESKIIFTQSNDRKRRPFYHFAFNIPENKIQQAYAWQRKRTPVIHPNPNGAKDEIVNFAHWNAHSIFFLDPAGNLLEYIARHDLPVRSEGDFTIEDIMYVSEIGFIVDDVSETGKILLKETGLTQYRAQADGFWPIGDESGLLLLIRKGRIWSSNKDEVNKTDVFDTSVEILSNSKVNFELKGYPYYLSSI